MGWGHGQLFIDLVVYLCLDLGNRGSIVKQLSVTIALCNSQLALFFGDTANRLERLTCSTVTINHFH